jgi:glycerol-3-phosphate dehydrogenase
MVWSYSGVRPLYDDGASKAQEATRDYVLKAEGAAGEPQLLNVFGGKITTYRRLAESMLEKIEDVLGKRGRPWTSGAKLPGGDFDKQGFEALLSKFRRDNPFLSEAHARRLIRLYGTRAWRIVHGAKTSGDLGRVFGGDLTEAEVAYLADNEWAREADDILWRRTKLGLKVDSSAAQAINEFLKSRPTAEAKIAAQ